MPVPASHYAQPWRLGKRVLLTGVLSLLPIATSLLVAPIASANDLPGTSVVEASQDFCIDPHKSCTGTSTSDRNNMGYEEVAAVNFDGKAHAKPSAVVLVCATTYKGSNGHLHSLVGHVFAGPTARHYDGGKIEGTMQIFNNANEQTRRAFSSVGVYATDPVIGTKGTAVGWQTTDNVRDVPVNGWIRVAIWGNLEDDDLVTHQQSTNTHRQAVCNIHLPYVIGAAPLGQPPDSEAVISDTDAD